MHATLFRLFKNIFLFPSILLLMIVCHIKSQCKVKDWPLAASLLSPERPVGGALFRCDAASRYTTGRPGWRGAGRTAPPAVRTAEPSPNPARLRHRRRSVSTLRGERPAAQTGWSEGNWKVREERGGGSKRMRMVSEWAVGTCFVFRSENTEGKTIQKQHNGGNQIIISMSNKT